MYFRQFWQDPRLSFERRLGLEKLVVGAEYIQLIWVPDTFFVNEKTAYFHSATTENQFLRILHTGEILRSIRWVISEKSQVYNKCNEKEAAAVYLWGQKPTSIDSSKLVGDNQHYFAKERESEIGISQGHFHTLFLRALAMITTFCKGHLLLKKPPKYVLYAYKRIKPKFRSDLMKAPTRNANVFITPDFILYIIVSMCIHL